MNTETELTQNAWDTHIRAKEYASIRLAYLTTEDALAIAYDALYFAAAATLTAEDPRAKDSPFAAGYIRACRDILQSSAGITLTIDDLRNPNE